MQVIFHECSFLKALVETPVETPGATAYDNSQN